MHDGRWLLCYQDDASRFVTGYGIFENATADNALAVLGAAIRNHGRPASIMTDHGSQFYSNEKEAMARGASTFEKRLVKMGIRQVWQASTTSRPTASSSACTGRSTASCTSSRR